MTATATMTRLKGILPPGRAVHDRGGKRGRSGVRLQLASAQAIVGRKPFGGAAFRKTGNR